MKNKNNFDLTSIISQLKIEENVKKDTDEILQNICQEILLKINQFESSFKLAIVLAAEEHDASFLELKVLAKMQNYAAGEKNFQINNLKIGFNSINNYCVKAYKERDFGITNDLADLLSPPLTPEMCGRLSKITNTKTYLFMPIILEHSILGVVIYGSPKNISAFAEDEINYINSLNAMLGLQMLNVKTVTDGNKQIETQKNEIEFWRNKLNETNQINTKKNTQNEMIVKITAEMSGDILKKMKNSSPRKGFENRAVIGLMTKITKQIKLLDVSEEPEKSCQSFEEVENISVEINLNEVKTNDFVENLDLIDLESFGDVDEKVDQKIE